MGKLETFEQYLTTGSIEVNLTAVIFAVIIAAILSHILGKVYVKYGTSLSNRRKFANNFLLLATTTTLIITVVKSSLALSLGLVGALSIVRFRAAIKEPEELGFLFLVIGIGLGLGAGQFLITTVVFLLICFLIIIRPSLQKKEESQNLSLTIRGKSSKKLDVGKITSVLKKNCASVTLKRFDSGKDFIETTFFVSFKSFNDIENAKRDIEKLSNSVSITYLERE